MDHLINPFQPGAGTPPPELAGREPILKRADIILGRVKHGKSEKSLLLVGLRGVGKTVLLNKIKESADAMGFKSLSLEIREDRSFAAQLLPLLRQILFDLDRMENISVKVKRGFRVLRSFFNSVKIKMGDVELSLDIDPELGTADSGDLEADLPVLLEAIAEAAKDRQSAVALFIDEMQYLTEVELSALIMAVHRISQKQLPLVVIGAGLPQLVALAGRSKSYAERLFDFPEVGPLNSSDAKEALRVPAQQNNVDFTQDALDNIVTETQGYPYFLQTWGYEAWNIADQSPINLQTVREAARSSIKKLDESFFRVRFDRLTPAERRYLRALAELGGGSHRSGDIADTLGVKVQSVAPLRNNLIRKGMIYSPAHGDTEFTVPLFDQFMKRIMPVLELRTK